MPTTYEPIATTTLGSAQSSITFSSISASYTDLVVVLSNVVCSVNSSNLLLAVGTGNSIDGGSNYSYTNLTGDGTTARSNRASNQTKILIGYWQAASNSTSYPSQAIYHIQNYSNTTTYKTVIGRGTVVNSTGGEVSAVVGLWRNTAAINTIQLYPDTGNYNAGTIATLYGIKAA